MTKQNSVCVMCSNNMICLSVVSIKFGGTTCSSCRNRMARYQAWHSGRSAFIRVPDACPRFTDEQQHYNDPDRVMSKYDWDYYVKGSRGLAVGKLPIVTSYENTLIVAKQRFCIHCAVGEADKVYKELLELAKRAG